MHQINLEKMSPVIGDKMAWPTRHLRRHRQPHAARGRAGRDRHRRRRPGSRERDAGPRLVDAPAGHRRRRTEAKRQPGITATDVVLALTEFLRKDKVVGRLPRILAKAREALTLGDRATISNMAPNTAPPPRCSSSTSRPWTTCAHRPRATQVVAGRNLRQDRRPVVDSLKTRRTNALTFDLSSVVRNMAGPSTRTPACHQRPGRQRASPAQWTCLPPAKAPCRMAP